MAYYYLPFLPLRYSFLRGKADKNTNNTAKSTDILASGLSSFLDKKSIEQLARETGFVQRKSKLNAADLLNSLMFSHQQGKELSLLDLCGDLYCQNNLLIKKQSIHERFNPEAVVFFKTVLSRLLERQFEMVVKDQVLSSFDRVRIKDSTRFALPDAYASTYKGHGGATHNSTSMISIQYEYDVCSGNTMDLRLTTGVRNDQRDAKENTHDIGKNDLFIRDLGYATMGYMMQIAENEAYFLNRLNPQVIAYHVEEPQKEVDFNKCHKKLKKYGLPYLEYQVTIGKKARIPCRLVIHRVDQSTYENRIRKTSKQAKSSGHQVSDGFKARAWLTAYVTNTTEAMIPASKIKQVYGLRWQIELTFKVWKSQGSIDKIKEMKICRFECQLIARLIWLLVHMKIYNSLTALINDQLPDDTLSIWKYYKHAYRINYLIREIITSSDKLFILLESLKLIAQNLFLLETKKGKKSHYQAIKSLT